MTRWLACGLILAGCKGEKDTAKETVLSFDNQTVLSDPDYATCSRENAVYWPREVFPVLAAGFPPVAPPYLITHVGAEVLTNDSCGTDVGRRLMVWVGSTQPDQLGIRNNGRPAFEPIAEVVITPESIREEHVAANGFTTYGVAQVALDPPVLVEEPGTLWVAAANYEPPDYAFGGAHTKCLAGCNDGGNTVYQWTEDDGWFTTQGLPLFRVTVAHN